VKTVGGLITKPGSVFREYLAGKRKTYYNQLAFYVLTTLIYIMTASLIHLDPVKDIMERTDPKNIALKIPLVN
jgi:hypothetical protein